MSNLPPYDPQSAILVPIPSALSGYNFENATFSLVDAGPGPAIGSCSRTPEQIFDSYSTARSAPGATFYVAINGGSDGANGLTSGTAFASIWKGITAANAAAVPTKIIIDHGVYPRANNPSFGNVNPAVDIAFVASNGRVITGTFDQYSAPSLDGTFTNCYSWAIANVDRVVDLLSKDRYGLYPNLQFVSSAAICNRTPGSWTTVGNATLYINRGDGAAVTNANTRVYRGLANNLAMNATFNIYIGDDGVAGYNGFDFEGGQYGGIETLQIVTPGSTRKIITAKNSTFKYCGGVIASNARGVSIDSFNGAAWFFRCESSGNPTDGFNCHNVNSAALMAMVTINCTGCRNGENTGLSDNGWTTHENVIGADIAGYYEGNHGGSVRSTNTSLSLLAGTYVKNDLGDTQFGGTANPAAFWTELSAAYYLFRTKADMPSGSFAHNSAAVGTSSIYKRQCWPSRGIDIALGTIGTW